MEGIGLTFLALHSLSWERSQADPLIPGYSVPLASSLLFPQVTLASPCCVQVQSRATSSPPCLWASSRLLVCTQALTPWNSLPKPRVGLLPPLLQPGLRDIPGGVLCASNEVLSDSVQGTHHPRIGAAAGPQPRLLTAAIHLHHRNGVPINRP